MMMVMRMIVDRMNTYVTYDVGAGFVSQTKII